MAYNKTVWKDQDVENPRTYTQRQNDDGSVTLLDHFGTITELGTPVNAENMNHIEDGIAAAVEKSSISQDLSTPSADTVPSTTAVSNESSRIVSLMNNILSTLYPVGSIYIGTQAACPLATLISGSTWTIVATKVAISVPTRVSVYGNGKNLVFQNGVLNLGLCSRSSGSVTVSPQWTTSTNVATGTDVAQYLATGGTKATGVIQNGSLSGLTGSIKDSTYLTVNIWKRTA